MWSKHCVVHVKDFSMIILATNKSGPCSAMQVAQSFHLIYEVFAKRSYWWETTWKSDLGWRTWHDGQWQEQIQLCTAEIMIIEEKNVKAD